MILETERLILRPWRESDAEDLYHYAKDQRVGPIAGWPPHTSVEESATIIKTVFSQEGVFAITLKEDDLAIGCIGLILGAKSNFPIDENEGEISYWLGVPFWGRGYIPEAIRKVVDYGFLDLKLSNIWCGYFDGNEKSYKAQSKCGFKHHHTEKDMFYELTNEIRTEHISCLSKEDWITENRKL